MRHTALASPVAWRERSSVVGVSSLVTVEKFEQLYLPFFPYASDDLTHIWREDRPQALTRRYVEANPRALSNLLVVDIDHSDAILRALADNHDYAPNFITENPLNGHAHAIWALSAPFPRTEYAHRKPLAFAEAVTEGLRRYTDGDKGYSGMMTKNPLHASWNTLTPTSHLYTLNELAYWLEENGSMPSKSWKRAKRRNTTALGRNCALFETARTWAYREVRKHFGDPDGLARSIHATAQQMNLEMFPDPLPRNEVKDIANSITRWITTKSNLWKDGAAVYEATFTAIQSARAHKRVEQKSRNMQELLLEAGAREEEA